jgi:hypothetical protein
MDIAFFAVALTILCGVLALTPRLDRWHDEVASAKRMAAYKRELLERTPFDNFLSDAQFSLSLALEKPKNRNALGIDIFEMVKLRDEINEKDRKKSYVEQLKANSRIHDVLLVKANDGSTKEFLLNIDSRQAVLKTGTRSLIVDIPAMARAVLEQTSGASK